MILLNFSYPLTDEQLARLAALVTDPLKRVIEIPSQVDPQQPMAPQVAALADACGLSASDWQTLPLLVNPPSLNFIAVVLMAELHGRCGYFPAMLRMRPVQGSVPPRFEVAEVVDLQGVRDAARATRKHG